MIITQSISIITSLLSSILLGHSFIIPFLALSSSFNSLQSSCRGSHSLFVSSTSFSALTMLSNCSSLHADESIGHDNNDGNQCVIKSNNEKTFLINKNEKQISQSTHTRHVFNVPALSPRTRALVYMSMAVSLHFAGYELYRNACLTMFTSSSSSSLAINTPLIIKSSSTAATGSSSSITAYSLANAFISPFSILLLYLYSQQLDRPTNNNKKDKKSSYNGPRRALRNTTAGSLIFIAIGVLILYINEIQQHQPQQNYRILSSLSRQVLVGLLFVFQNSYQYLLYTQQWSFISSVMTPQEGTQWFTRITGFSTLTCTLIGCTIPYLVPYVGLLGLMTGTCIFLFFTLISSDRAYALAQQYGFDPTIEEEKTNDDKTVKRWSSVQQHNKAFTTTTADKAPDNTVTSTPPPPPPPPNRLHKAWSLFGRVPTLRRLFIEVLAFQSLNTILNVAFVNALQTNIPNDVSRSAFSGRFFALVNATAAMLQFLVLPTAMKHCEPAWIWRTMPLIPLGLCLAQQFPWITSTIFSTNNSSSLMFVTASFFVAKVLDYSIRSVVYVMVYQPLDFDCRYFGKEVIGIFGTRFGKSGMSVILSALSAMNVAAVLSLNELSLVAAGMWFVSTLRLSSLLPTKAEAQAVVEKRSNSNYAYDEAKKQE